MEQGEFHAQNKCLQCAQVSDIYAMNFVKTTSAVVNADAVDPKCHFIYCFHS